jgi:DNA-binding PadR family transcriptional regulator
MFGEQSGSLRESDEVTTSVQNGRDTARAHKSTTYELFVLGELMDGPHHGYQLREILSNMLGPFRQMSWGVLYPLIRQLEHEGLLVSDTESNPERREGRASSNRQRKQYRLTESGRERFHALMVERGDYTADYRELFLIKLNNFDHISKEEQLTLLRHYRGYLQIEDFYLQRGQQHVSIHPGIPDTQRAHILRIIDFRQSSIQAETHWIADQIARGEEGSEAMS